MRVAVVGMGAAGLRAAMLLEQAGHSVLLYEARPRLGGKIFTVRDTDCAYEAGAEWLDADHYRTLGLMNQLGIEPENGGSWPRKILYRGETCWDTTLWNDALEDDLRVEAAARELCRDLHSVPWMNNTRHDLEHRTLDDFLREHTRSERGLWWVTAKARSDEGEDPERIGLLGWLVGYMHYLDRDGDVMSAFRVPGGMDRLIQGMADALQTQPNLECVLRRVRRDSECVSLQFDTFEVEVDHAVLTLPPPALEQVVFDPPLSPEKRCAIEACEMSRAIKIAWTFDYAWWRDEDWNGSLMCDLPIQQVWDGTRGERPILMAYVCGEQACQWLKDPHAADDAFSHLADLAPQAKKHYRYGSVHDWVLDPYAKGAFSHLAPGYVLEYMRHVSQPEDRVHFAGEFTGTWTGFVEGALESAERVVKEIGRD